MSPPHIQKSPPQKSMRQRLLLGMAAGFLLILALLSIGFWSYAQQAANASYDRLLRGAALSILERIYLSGDNVRVDIPYSSLETLGLAKDDRIFYRIFTQDNVTITASHALVPAINYQPKETPVYWEDWFSGEPVRFMQQARLLTGNRKSVWVIVQLGQTRIARNDMMQDFFWRGFIVALFITCVGLFFVWIGINRALHPLIDIERDLRKRDISDFTPLKATPPREVASLISSINGFIFRLKNNLDNSQIFIADVTHQIRTALSALQGQLELAGEELDPHNLQDRLERAKKQSKHTIHLTNQLLSHAMVIHRADHQVVSDLHLISVLKGSLEHIIRDQVKSDIEFSLSIDPKLERDKGVDHEADLITGDEISIREAIRNIIDNAIKHGPKDNQIDISLFTSNDQIVLKVDDAGPGIPCAKRDKAIERFYTTMPEGEGTGLGLSIVHQVALSHTAKLSLSSSPNGGLGVSLSFTRKSGEQNAEN